MFISGTWVAKNYSGSKLPGYATAVLLALATVQAHTDINSTKLTAE